MDFDALAKVYGGMEVLCAGRLMQRVRTAHLAACPDHGRVLLAGEGHGRTLAALRKLKPGLELTYLDASPAMQQAARHHLARQGLEETGITFHTGNALTFLPEETRYEVIITPFFLDCFTEAELRVLIPRLASLAMPADRGDYVAHPAAADAALHLAAVAASASETTTTTTTKTT